MSPFSFVRFAGRPEARASSRTCLFPSRAALYIWAASRIASSDGENAVADVMSVLILGVGVCVFAMQGGSSSGTGGIGNADGLYGRLDRQTAITCEGLRLRTE